MFMSRIGEFAALMTAVFWTFSAIAFERASRRAGSLSINWLRLLLGLVMLSIFTLFTRGQLLPLDAPGRTWLWLSISGLVGFSIGDLALFEAFVVIGSRISMLVMAAAPPLTVLFGWLFLGETLSGLSLLGMAITLGGICLVCLERGDGEKKLSHPVKGVFLAAVATLGQAIGLIMSKYGMGTYSPFAATQIRIIAGLAGFSLIFLYTKRWSKIALALKNRKVMVLTTSGALFGPFLGVSFSLLAVQRTMAGVAATIMATVPVLIIPPAVLLMHEKVTLREVIGAVMAVAGVALLFL